MPLRRYLVSFFLVTMVFTAACSFLPMVTRSHVLAGTSMEETWKSDFVLPTPSGKYYILDPGLVDELQQQTRFIASGPLRVLSAEVRVEAKKVSWSTGRSNTVSAPGGQMTTRIRWQAVADAADGAKGEIRLDEPNYAITLHSGSAQKYQDRWVFREVNVYQSALSLWEGRFEFAIWIGLPAAAMAYHTWLLIFVLRGRRRARARADVPPAEAPLPRTFSANPVVLWITWSIFLLISGFVGVLIAVVAGFNGFLSSLLAWVGGGFFGAGVLGGLITLHFLSRSLLTVKVDAEYLSYRKLRGDGQWMELRWSELEDLRVRSWSYRGNRSECVEIILPNGSKQKVSEASLADYNGFKHLALALFAHHHQLPPPAA